MLNICSQRLYALRMLRNQGLDATNLTTVFQAFIIACISYAICSWGGFATQSNVDKINALFKRSLRTGLTNKLFTFESLLESADHKLFNNSTNPIHCLNQIMPPVKPSSGLRKRGHDYQLPPFKYESYRQSFLLRCLYKYL